MNQARIKIAKPDILKMFDTLSNKVFKQSELGEILQENRSFWRLAQSTNTQNFIDFLTKTGHLSTIIFPFPKPYNRETRYIWGDVPLPEVFLTLKPNCHFSHYTAVQIHELTEQVPKTTYLNFEQPLASTSTGTLAQKSIDTALSRKVRTTSYVAETLDFRVCLLNGKNTGYLGVVSDFPTSIYAGRNGKTRVTDLERTLIDIAVRPIYSGGTYEVLKAYRLAMHRVSVNRMAAMLQTLNYTYPYHQVIGFYLERAGYKPNLLDLLKRFPMDFDFYLTHQMIETDYVPDWRLHVPKGF